MRWLVAIEKAICVAFVATFISLGAGISARADTYDWSFVCDIGNAGCIGGGTLDTNVAIGPATVTSISGTWGGNPITSLIPPGGYTINDNIINALSPAIELNLGGISFVVGAINWNIYYSGSAASDQWLSSNGRGGDGVFTVTERPSEVPLSGALPLFGTGLAALGLLGWRRKRKQAAA
jgi:hypothetical protein